MAGCLLDRPHLCAAGSPSHRDGGDWHLLHAAAMRLCGSPNAGAMTTRDGMAVVLSE